VVKEQQIDHIAKFEYNADLLIFIVFCEMLLQNLIESMHLLDPVVLQGCIFIFCMISIVTMLKFFGKAGIYVYSVMMVIIANIQVLKAANIAISAAPVPLGNIVFTTLFFATDILAEIYGKKEAEKSVWLGFASYLIFSIIMVLTIGIRPLEGEGYIAFSKAHDAISYIFTPSLPLFVSSLAAYIISLYFDIFAFITLKNLFGEKLLWLRTSLSTILGIILDNIVFSFLAWVIFAVIPIDFEIVVNTYILGTLKIRLLLTIATIPVFYFVKQMVKKSSE